MAERIDFTPDVGFEPDSVETPSKSSQPSGMVQAMQARQRAEAMATMLPAILGGGAGLAFGRIPIAGQVTPVRSAAAGLGGGVGEGLRQLATGQPLNMQQIMQQGAVQAGSEAAGGLIAKGAGAVGKAAMQGALRPTIETIREFPDVLQTMLKQHIPVGKAPIRVPFTSIGKYSGSEIAEGKMRESGAHLGALLDQAEQAGVTFDAKALLGPVKQLARDIKKQPLSDADIKALHGKVNEFLATHSGKLTPNNLKDLKRAAWEVAKPVLKAQKKGTAVVDAASGIDARFNKAIGKGAQKALEGIQAGGIGKKIAGRERITQSLKGATMATKRAEDAMQSGVSQYIPSTLGRGAAMGTGAVIGGALPAESPQQRMLHAGEGALASAFLLSPPALSRIALALSDPVNQELLRQLPRPLLSMMFPPYSPQPDAAKEGNK